MNNLRIPTITHMYHKMTKWPELPLHMANYLRLQNFQWMNNHSFLTNLITVRQLNPFRELHIN